MDSRVLNLMVGAGLKLEKHDSEVCYLVELLGYKVGKGVIISAPQESDDRIAIKPGDEVTVRYLGGTSNYAFRSQVVQVSTVPYPHVHLAYPGGVEATMTRRAIRVPVKQQAVRLALSDNGQQISVAMDDISHGGARLVAAKALANEGDRFSIDMPTQAPDRESVLSLSCVVRYVREKTDGEQTTFYHGIEFQGMDAAARVFISRFIHSNLESCS